MTNEQLVIRVKAGEDTAGNMLKLWQQNKGFIAKMAKKYQGYAEMDDLMQEGYIALCEAVRQYDPEQGVTFLHYAAFWIRQAMQRYIDNCCQPVRIPVHAQDAIRKYKKAVREYRQYYGCEPPERALCAILDVDRESLHTIQENARMGQIDSLSRVIGGEEEDLTIEDTVASGEDVEDDCIRAVDLEMMQREVWLAVDQLPDRLRDTVKCRYRDGMTLEQTGQHLGVNRSYVADLERKAFRLLSTERRGAKLRRYCEEYIAASPIHHVGVESFNRTWTSEVERDALMGL